MKTKSVTKKETKASAIVTVFVLTILSLLSCHDNKKEDNNNDGYQVFYNAKVYTSDHENQTATAFVIKDGKFVYVGNDTEALKYSPGINMEGKRIIPGIIDSHCHIVGIASMLSSDPIMFDMAATKEEILGTLKETIKEEPWKNAKYIVGAGFGPAAGTHLLASELDAIDSNRPIIISSADGHAAWANTKMLEIAGINASFPDPQPDMSYFVRDEAGNPTGLAVEIMAFNYLYKKLYEAHMDNEQLTKFYATLPLLFHEFNKYGHTACLDAGFIMDERMALKALKQMESNDQLTLKIAGSYFLSSTEKDLPGAISKMKQLKSEFKSDLFELNTLKLYLDGTVELTTALMEDPYCAPADGTGAQLIDYETILSASKLAANEGFNIHAHAIGDKAINLGLRLFEELGRIKGTKTIAHAQVMPVGGVERFANIDNAYYQTTPYWLMADELTPVLLGRERYLRQLPLASLKENKVPLCFGSDYSGYELSYNPFFNSFFAVNRAFDNGQMIIEPQAEGITIEDCIDGYTIGGAQSMGWADRTGSITVGKCADFVILNQDIMTIEPSKIKDVTVNKTFLNGKCVYSFE